MYLLFETLLRSLFDVPLKGEELLFGGQIVHRCEIVMTIVVHGIQMVQFLV